MVRDTGTALLDTAEKVVRMRGFDGFSYADLSAVVGIRKASIHYHFPTKADLSAALLDRYHKTLEARCVEIDQRHATAAGRLLDLIALYRAALDGGAMMCLCVALVSGRDALSDTVCNQIQDFRGMMARWIATVFDLGQRDGTITGIGPVEQEARATLAVLEGGHLAARSQADLSAFDDALAILRARCRA